MRVRIPHPADFTSRLHSPSVTSRVGLWLGVCVTLAFLTGVFSHWSQAHEWWLPFPTRPVWAYRVTQGVHVIAGTAAVPLLLVKLWTVYPRLFQRVPWRSARALVLHGLERASIALLVSSAVFELATGLPNSAKWYPFPFLFRPVHYAVGWVLAGSLAVHVAVKLPLVRRALGAPLDAPDEVVRPDPPVRDEVPGSGEAAETPRSPVAAGRGLTRRGLLRSTWVAAGAAVVGSAGISVPYLRDVSVFGVRSGDGPMGVPVNRSAAKAGVTRAMTGPAYRLALVHGDRTLQLTEADLLGMPQTTADLPISCVEGWSVGATWTGVRVRHLLDLVGAPPGSDVHVDSLQTHHAYASSLLQGEFADDPLTLLALRLNGRRLDLDHGYPCRLIAPARPGVLQTKWVKRMQVRM